MDITEAHQRKHLKLASTIRRQLDDIVRRDLSDPRIGFVTFTAVRLTRDNRRAVVYASPLGNENQQKETIAGLKSAASYIRRALSSRLQMKYTPELEFVRDETKSDRIEQILKDIKNEEKT
jgi:ribosome-binding factor A